jgi:hypothetical protein
VVAVAQVPQVVMELPLLVEQVERDHIHLFLVLILHMLVAVVVVPLQV